MKILDRKTALAMLLALIVPILAACAAPAAQQPIRETVVVTAEPGSGDSRCARDGCG